MSFLNLRNLEFFKNTAERRSANDDGDANLSFAGGALAIASKVRVEALLYELRFDGNDAEIGQHAAFNMKYQPSGWDEWANLRFEARNPGVSDAALYTKFQFVGKALNPLSVDNSRRLPSTCYNDRPIDIEVDTVVIHFTSAANILPSDPYNLDAILGIFTRESAPSEVENTSAHYLIDRAGTVYSLVDEGKRAWHAGRSRMPDGREDVKSFSIGVEMVRLENGEPTIAQYEALAQLVYDLKRRHPKLRIENIIGHDTIRLLWNKEHPTSLAPVKRDPGPLFLWPRVIRDLGGCWI